MVKQQIIDTIIKYDTIIIHRHVRPDPDALGSQSGLAEMIKLSFPEKIVYVVGEEDPALTFLVEMDEIPDEAYEGALVITCDTANTGRISDQRYDLGAKLIKIDHHPNNDAYGDLLWIDTSASSTSEMIYELYLFGKEKYFTINDTFARLIYAGIVGDTGRFLFSSTNDRTFQYAAELIQFPFNRSELYNNLYDIDVNIARLRGFILQNFTLSAAGVSSVKLTQEILQEYNMEPMETSNLVSVLGEIKGIKAWAMFIEEDDIIRVRLRSKGPIINELAAEYRGGGHPLAAGASVYSWEEADELVEKLERICANNN